MAIGESNLFSRSKKSRLPKPGVNVIADSFKILYFSVLSLPIAASGLYFTKSAPR